MKDYENISQLAIDDIWQSILKSERPNIPLRDKAQELVEVRLYLNELEKQRKPVVMPVYVAYDELGQVSGFNLQPFLDQSRVDDLLTDKLFMKLKQEGRLSRMDKYCRFTFSDRQPLEQP